MRQRPKTLGFAFLLTLLSALHVAHSADAASVSRRCRGACRDEIAACVAGGGRPRACRRSLLGRCKREGVAVCQGRAGQFSGTLAGDCSSPTVVPEQGGTFSGTTSGTSSLAGTCGSSGSSPEQVFQWTPAVSGLATIETCGSGTTYDSVLYLRAGSCTSGAEVQCNDDACANSTGLIRASRLTPTVSAGTTYYIVVDGFGGASGSFALRVTPPAAPPTTTTTPPAPTTTTTTTAPTTTTSTPTPTTTT